MPLSGDPAKRAKSLANLRRGPSDDPAVRERQLQNLRPAPAGNQRRLVHNAAYSVRPLPCARHSCDGESTDCTRCAVSEFVDIAWTRARERLLGGRS